MWSGDGFGYVGNYCGWIGLVIVVWLVMFVVVGCLNGVVVMFGGWMNILYVVGDGFGLLLGCYCIVLLCSCSRCISVYISSIMLMVLIIVSVKCSMLKMVFMFEMVLKLLLLISYIGRRFVVRLFRLDNSKSSRLISVLVWVVLCGVLII